MVQGGYVRVFALAGAASLSGWFAGISTERYRTAKQQPSAAAHSGECLRRNELSGVCEIDADGVQVVSASTKYRDSAFSDAKLKSNFVSDEKLKSIDEGLLPPAAPVLPPTASTKSFWDSADFSWSSLATRGLELFGSVVSAATTGKILSPPIERDADVPAEPPQHASRTSQIMRLGFPGMDNVRSFQDYVLSYDRQKRIAHWVCEHLTKESVAWNDKVDRARCEFHEDHTLHHYFRSSSNDYKASGYDRGHLAAAGNHRRSQDHCLETFVLSNMAPQVGRGFNRDAWNSLEKYVRGLTRSYRNVYVCTGPLFLPKREMDGKIYVKYEVIGMQQVAVPTHFYKVIVGETEWGTFELESYVLPNQSIAIDVPLTSFMVPPESIERSAGLLFFDRLAKHKLSSINRRKWA